MVIRGSKLTVVQGFFSSRLKTEGLRLCFVSSRLDAQSDLRLKALSVRGSILKVIQGLLHV